MRLPPTKNIVEFQQELNFIANHYLTTLIKQLQTRFRTVTRIRLLAQLQRDSEFQRREQAYSNYRVHDNFFDRNDRPQFTLAQFMRIRSSLVIAVEVVSARRGQALIAGEVISVVKSSSKKKIQLAQQAAIAQR